MARLGNPEQCAKELGEAAAILRALDDTAGSAALYRRYATALIDNSDSQGAAAALQGYVEMVERLHGPDSLNAAMALRMLGACRMDAGMHREALPALQRSKRLMDAHLGPRHQRCMQLRDRIARCTRKVAAPSAGAASTALGAGDSESDSDDSD